ncbi:hypothetical protein UCRPA7_3061 [Phaeoacremonium minimum UCRPA7]|uniref:Uncharacterized protein n=1 Tax=Phaeoacremonium minimum (strain UCR-PA7) TaxID=1286976 RepID=R8BQC9_PHAM7|nr:hypothetical protein UCRPA7_3061 [Phaeoacremonium minimum UCRPA7]EOO01490.1 hypothetical protein UCRPA7_3061 [Phaeoacremonium minimum UCRPA7]
MADNGEDVAQLLAFGVATPIAELGPELTESQKRVVRGEVTITWPYNSVNKSLAFLLAEPDVRLRRAKGLIRVQLNGASAEAVAGCNLGGGDEVLLSLDGVGWEKDDAPARPAGSRSDWQLKFSNKIILQVSYMT